MSNNFDLMQKSLDALWLRQKVISNNIANKDTPGYKAKMVEFENLLAQLMESQGGNIEQLKLEDIEPLVVRDETLPIREDGNNVDMDGQNIELVRTMLQFEYSSRLLSDDISRLKYVINEGRR